MCDWLKILFLSLHLLILTLTNFFRFKNFFSEARTLLIYFKPFSPPPLQIPSYWPGKMQLRECVWTLGSCVLLKLISSKTQQNTSKIGNDQDRIKFDISLHPLSLPFKRTKSRFRPEFT